MKRLQQIKATIEDADDVELVTPGRELVRELACKIVEKKSRVIDGRTRPLFVCASMRMPCFALWHY